MSTSSSKEEKEHVEDDLEQAPTHATYIEKDSASSISPEHREYLIQRHGTIDLDPLPGFGNADPYNWPSWKKITNLVLVAWHACMSTFIAAAIIPAYGEIAEDFGTSVQNVSYLTSLQIATLGVAPLFWRPLADRFGRRPIFLLSLVVSLVGNVGCAESHSYSAMAGCRALVAFFISPAAAIGSGVVVESFFKKERARYMGIWTLMVTLGVPLSPFIFGFVSYRLDYRWIYWILAMINGVQLILYLFLGPETRYLRRGVSHEGSNFKQQYLTFRRIDTKPLNFLDFVRPIAMVMRPPVAIAAAAYAMIFLFGNVMISVELPQLFLEKFHFNPQQLGLQFIGSIVGSVIGEQIGGSMSDLWMKRRARRGPDPQPEYRLWVSYGGYLLTICGVVVFLVRTEQAPELHWNVTPIIGAAIAAAGNQIVTTVLITYAVDCYRDEAASVGVFITLVRQLWGFIGPFWFPSMFANVGVANSSGVATVMIIVVSIVPTILLQWKGTSWR
ncbi:MFS general substrate transporter [Aulographum hederae CBS 113979]|uniref:MFS general substrate transporter n=1 Tax=Aulographum hederae CBS 113979 TaxID=1176131 RepID=A0A6G1H5V5_9PEZI|nr:MFS general substrate transporter [Aulographum hederae CBS 113979]